MSELEAVYILHRRSWRETSLIIDIFSVSHGRMSVLARGAKRKRGMNGILQAFQPLLMTWTGKSDLKTLTHCESTTILPALTGQHLLSAMYVNELILKLCPQGDSLPDIFAAYGEMIVGIQDNIQHSLRKFELHLLHCMGWNPDFSCDDKEQEIDLKSFYTVHPIDGLHRVQQDTFRCFSGEVIQACHLFKPEITDKQKEMRNLMRTLIDFHLQGRELKTRKMGQQMMRWSKK